MNVMKNSLFQRNLEHEREDERGGSLDGADELFPPVEKEYQRVVEALKALE